VQQDADARAAAEAARAAAEASRAEGLAADLAAARERLTVLEGAWLCGRVDGRAGGNWYCLALGITGFTAAHALAWSYT
jgi:hypothetical protein